MKENAQTALAKATRLAYSAEAAEKHGRWDCLYNEWNRCHDRDAVAV